jgi:hypothetical protein
MISGCACDRSMSVDGQYDFDYMRESFFYHYDKSLTPGNLTFEYLNENFTSRFYRGPYSYAVSDFVGYSCGQSMCPKGDNPLTQGVNEIQLLHCNATGGHFQLTFRLNTTLVIYPNDTTADLALKLQQLPT